MAGEAAAVESLNRSAAAGVAKCRGRPNTDVAEEVRVESAGVDGDLQRADVEFLGQLAERQQLRLLRVMFDRRPGRRSMGGRHGAQAAVPHAKRVQGHVEPPSKVALGEIRVATQLAKPVHAEHTMLSAAAVVKRPPACLAGDHDHVRHDSARSGNGCLEKCSRKATITNSRECGAHSPD